MKMRTVQHKFSRSLAIMSVFLVGLLLTFQSVLATEDQQIVDPPMTAGSQEMGASASDTNLLTNGSMDELSFYFRPTNHFVAGMWYEWFVNGAYRIPEFIDGGSPYHQACYPIPSDRNCEKAQNHSQGYILWSGKPFVAGIYQPVTVTPCQMYQFTAYARNDASYYLSKVGIDPTGEILSPDPGNIPWNCPPDGKSICPNPGVSSPEFLPSNIVWSSYSSGPVTEWLTSTVAAEALSTTISVWTYTDAVIGNGPQSAYWDMTTLTTTTYPDNRLPAPAAWTSSTFITNVVMLKSSSRVTVTWKTTEAAIGQVWYERLRSTGVTTSPTAAYTQYFPLIMQNYMAYPFETTPDTTHVLTHSAVLSDLKSGDRLTLYILSRHFATDTCKTEVYGPLYVTVP